MYLSLCGLTTSVIKIYQNIEPAEWDELGHLSEFLGSFLEFTEVVSARNSPTIHLVVPRIVLISERIGVLAEHCNRVIRLAAATMQAKFDKYFADIPPIMIIANVLDPRCKLDFLRDVLGLGDQALQHTEYLFANPRYVPVPAAPPTLATSIQPQAANSSTRVRLVSAFDKFYANAPSANSRPPVAPQTTNSHLQWLPLAIVSSPGSFRFLHLKRPEY